jgi:hypothetical protein
MKKELELETLEERRQILRLILMYKVVEWLVQALPTDAFVTFSKRKRQIKPKTFEDCVTVRIEKSRKKYVDCLTYKNIVWPLSSYENQSNADSKIISEKKSTG